MVRFFELAAGVGDDVGSAVVVPFVVVWLIGLLLVAILIVAGVVVVVAGVVVVCWNVNPFVFGMNGAIGLNVPVGVVRNAFVTIAFTSSTV